MRLVESGGINYWEGGVHYWHSKARAQGSGGSGLEYLLECSCSPFELIWHLGLVSSQFITRGGAGGVGHVCIGHVSMEQENCTCKFWLELFLWRASGSLSQASRLVA